LPRIYQYVGPHRLADQASASIDRLAPKSGDDIRTWSLAPPHGVLELTYVVTEDHRLWLSDRHSEHVACARGKPVLAAGEIVLRITPTRVTVVSVTNQSTGYCPEPACWPELRRALDAAGLSAPSHFTHAFDFRRCTSCSAINVLKSEMPECPSCDTELPAQWNFGE
jgi:hypothetical protein